MKDRPLPAAVPRPALVDEIQAYWAKEAASFHMPGHKAGQGAHPLAHEIIGSAAIRADVSEMGGFDYLHAPEGNLLRAESFAAELFGVDQTHFLINGSTVGNIAAIAATVHDDDKLLMFRGSHRSVFTAVVLTGATPVYVEPVYHPDLDAYFGADIQLASSALERHPDIKAIHITRPSYYGLCCDFQPYVELAHAHGIPLIVDEAHGAHFAFHPALPLSATTGGADLIIQSTHKTLGALTQSSMLHRRGSRVDALRLAQNLQMLQSSSPSALLLLSLDIACAQMASEGYELLEHTVQLAACARKQINTIGGVWCYGDDITHRYGIDTYDQTKLVIDVHDIGLTGFAASACLRSQKGIGVELADFRRIVCSFTIGDTEQTCAQLVASLQDLAQAHRHGEAAHQATPSIQLPGIPEMAVSPRRATSMPSFAATLHQAIGRICAEYVMPYPPGIPLVVPGERLDADLIATLIQLQESGCKIVGPADQSLRSLRVLQVDE